MTETNAPQDEDQVRRHSEDPAEGPDPDEGTAGAEPEQPREHPEEPAEG